MEHPHPAAEDRRHPELRADFAFVERQKRITLDGDAIILCAGTKRETIEILDLGRSGIHVAEYLTELPSRELLRERFQQAIATARATVEQRSTSGDRDDA